MTASISWKRFLNFVLAEEPLVKIVVLDGHCLNPGDLDWGQMEKLGKLEVHARTSPDQLLDRARDAEILITNKCPLSNEVIDQLPSLTYVGVTATGYNVVDPAHCKSRGITVTNAPGYSTASVAQTVFAHILHHTNQVEMHANSVRDGQWEKCSDFCYTLGSVTELAGKNLGILGFGAIGGKTAEIGKAFEMKVLAHSRSLSSDTETVRSVGLNDLFEESDFLSLHCPLNESTHHIINCESLVRMKESSVLINTARGPLIDEWALADTLNREGISAAYLDVLSTEPPSSDNPLIRARNCQITPHYAWASLESRRRLMKIVCENLVSFLKGTPKNQVI